MASNPFQTVEKGKGIKASEWLVSLGIDELSLPKISIIKDPTMSFQTMTWRCVKQMGASSMR
jgi:hypothetical protein